MVKCSKACQPFWKRLVFGCVVLAAAGAELSAQTLKSKETKTAEQRSASDPAAREKDRAAIRRTVEELVAAFASGDAEKAAAVLTEEAELIPFEGPSVVGREEIKTAYEAHFARHPRTQIKLKTESLRFLSRNAAVEEGVMHVTLDDKAPRTNHYSLLHLREDGKWLIGEIRESSTGVENLSELSWLIGDWSAQQGDTELKMKYDWFGEKAFVRGTFTVRFKDRTLTGMQLIGADPQSGQLRIWVFEHDGGFAEGTCTRDGESWLFETNGAFSNGEKWSARNVLLRINQDAITWQPVMRTIGDERVDDAPPVKVTRIKTAR